MSDPSSKRVLPRQLVAASLRPVMLTLLSERPMYGYEIIQRVHAISDGQINWTANKLYPLLHDLENKGCIEAFWKPSDSGPDRKYYRLTETGLGVLRVEIQNWLDLDAILRDLWGPKLQSI